jgi:FkbM family methyltransferase
MNFDKNIRAALLKPSFSAPSRLVIACTSKAVGIYVVGKNDQSHELIKRYKVLGLIDDFAESYGLWNGVPIVKTRDLDRSSVVVNCATSISPALVKNSLLTAGFYNIISVSDLISTPKECLSLPWFVRQQREEYGENSAWWSELHRLLSDDISRRTLRDVLRFRLTADVAYLEDYQVRLQDQYLEDFMDYREEVFVDAGAFDGDTTEQFVNRYPDYKKVYLFEPSKKSIAAARRRLSGKRDIELRELGLSDYRGVLRFNSDSGSASAITDGPGESIMVAPLDEEMPEGEVSFIKMDLEGWETRALLGAQRIISCDKPKMAIAVYHSARDFRLIPQYILGLNPKYKIFLRHYTQGWSETVMFFL